jgi:hypothetical protein
MQRSRVCTVSQWKVNSPGPLIATVELNRFTFKFIRGGFALWVLAREAVAFSMCALP